MIYFEFNMRDPHVQRRARPPRLRARDQPAAARRGRLGRPRHAGDRARSPTGSRDFYSPNVPRYEYAPKKAEATAGRGRLQARRRSRVVCGSRSTQRRTMRTTCGSGAIRAPAAPAGRHRGRRCAARTRRRTSAGSGRPTSSRLNLYGISNTTGSDDRRAAAVLEQEHRQGGAVHERLRLQPIRQMDRISDAAQVEADPPEARKLWDGVPAASR